MLSNIKPPAMPESKECKISEGLKGFVGRRLHKEVAFMDGKVKINKLNVSEVESIQEKAKELQEALKAGNEKESFALLRHILDISVEGAKDLSEEDFRSLPLDELNKLSEEVLSYAGVRAQQGN